MDVKKLMGALSVWALVVGTALLGGSPVHAQNVHPADAASPVAAHLADDCSWTGLWGSAFSEAATGNAIKQLVVNIEQLGAGSIIGIYAYVEDPNKLGTMGADLSGAVANGEWAEEGSSGRFRIEMAGNCNEWTGTWGNGQSADDGGVWAGSRAG